MHLALFFSLFSRLVLYFFSSVLGLWIARVIRPITDLIPFVHSFFDPKFIPGYSFYYSFSIYSSFFFLFVVFLLGGFRLDDKFNFTKDLFFFLRASFFWGVFIVFYFVFVFYQPIFSRMILIQGMFFTIFLCLLFKFVFFFFYSKFTRKIISGRKLCIIGDNEDLNRVEKIFRNTYSNIKKIDVKNIEFKDSFYKCFDEFIVISNLNINLETKIREFCFCNNKVFKFIPSSSKVVAKLDIEILNGILLINPQPTLIVGFNIFLKRLFDIIVSLLLIIFLLPLFLIIMVKIKLDSKGNIFYRSTRIKQGGENFVIFKFRSMIDNADSLKEDLQRMNHRYDGPYFKIKNDPRVTKFGKFLRRTSFDELPQLWNVLKGDMSLVGPRPHLLSEINNYTLTLKRVLSVKPGLTGVSQVAGRSDLSFQEEIELDLFYIENWNIFLDVSVLIKTLLIPFRSKGAD